MIPKDGHGIETIFMKSESVFLDSNIFVYSVDNSAGEKQKTAKHLLTKHEQENNGVISTQVLQEFYVVATKKLGIIPDLARTYLNAIQDMETVIISPILIDEAIGLQLRFQISFWDALILQSAVFSNCQYLYTEDLNHGQKYCSVTVLNPFTNEINF